MKFLDKVKGYFTGGKERDVVEPDEHEPEVKREFRKVKVKKPTCSIAMHKNRRYDGTLRGSIDATKLGETL